MTRLLQPVLDSTDAVRAAAFYLSWLGEGWGYTAVPAPGADWVVLRGPAGERLAFQLVESLTPATWPAPDVPQQAHLDFLLDSPAAVVTTRDTLLGLGAPLLLDRGDDPHEPLYVFADPDGHPFCVFAEAA